MSRSPRSGRAEIHTARSRVSGLLRHVDRIAVTAEVASSSLVVPAILSPLRCIFIGREIAAKSRCVSFCASFVAGVETCRLASIFSDAAIKSLSEVMATPAILTCRPPSKMLPNASGQLKNPRAHCREMSMPSSSSSPSDSTSQPWAAMLVFWLGPRKAPPHGFAPGEETEQSHSQRTDRQAASGASETHTDLPARRPAAVPRQN
jgi:hypothetical protein